MCSRRRRSTAARSNPSPSRTRIVSAMAPPYPTLGGGLFSGSSARRSRPPTTSGTRSLAPTLSCSENHRPARLRPSASSSLLRDNERPPGRCAGSRFMWQPLAIEPVLSYRIEWAATRGCATRGEEIVTPGRGSSKLDLLGQLGEAVQRLGVAKRVLARGLLGRGSGEDLLDRHL